MNHPEHPPPRRRWLTGLAPLAAGTALLASPLRLLAQARPAPATALPVMQVWKDPNCGCCHEWIRYLHNEGFKTQVFDTGNTAVRQRLRLPARYGSCHTALIGGYVVEGHVHADDIRRLLAERPQAVGLAVPGMPVGSPGMDGPEYGGRRDPHDTLLVLPDGSARAFRSHT